jgi:hypothetical protein
MCTLTDYWPIAAIHVGSISLFSYAALDTRFQPVTNSLRAAAQRIERNAHPSGESLPAVDLLASLIAVILQYQLPAFERQLLQASLETFLFFVSLFQSGRDE